MPQQQPLTMRFFPRTRDIHLKGVEDILAAAADPALMLRLIIKDIEQALIDVRGREAALLQESRALHRAAEAAERRQTALTEKARHALVDDREDLARDALNEKHASIGDVAELRQRIEILSEQARGIEAEAARLEAVLAEVRAGIELHGASRASSRA